MRRVVTPALLACALPAALLATLVSGMVSGPAVADPDPPAEVPSGRLVLLLDSSGSMNEPAAGGQTRIEAARAALTDVVDRLPDGAQVGMRVFGATVFSRKQPGACTDTQNVVPVGPLDRGALTAAIGRYEPYGETPIGNALKGAARDLGSQGKRSIVLLSDGEPTCAPNPCLVARDLRRQGVGLTVNVVGLDVDGPAQRALECIARAGGGTYYDVSDPTELAGSLVSVSVRALREFAVEGTPVDGGPRAAQATPIGPGQYTDRLDAGQTSAFYEIAKQPGWGVNAGVSARPPDRGALVEGVTVALRTPAGARCAVADARRTNVLAERAIVSAGASYVPGVTKYADETCRAARALVLEVSYEGGADTDYELVVSTQPPVRQSLASLPGPVTDQAAWGVPARAEGRPEPVVGGSGFGNAPVLAPGVYTDTVRPGEQLLYKVQLGWGQAARVTFTAEPDRRVDDLLGAVGNTMEAEAFNPLRHQLSSIAYGAAATRDGGLYNGSEPLSLSAVTVPVRLRNATGGFQVADTHLAGTYTVSVAMGSLDADTRFAVPLRIEVEVVGRAEPGPVFAEDPASASPEAEGAGAAAADSDSAGAAAAQSDRADDAGNDGLTTALLAAGGSVLVLGAAAVVVARRRRSGAG